MSERYIFISPEGADWSRPQTEPAAPTPEATWRVIARETVAKLRKAADEIERCLDAK